MKYQYVGALRAVGVVVLIAVLQWLSDATNLAFIGNPAVVTLVVAVATAIEHGIEEVRGKALFGAVKV